MEQKTNIMRSFLFLVLMVLLSLVISTKPQLIHAQQASLDWQSVSNPNDVGEFTLALSGNVPTTVVAFEFVITFDENQISFLDVEAVPDGIKIAVEKSTPGLVKLIGEGSSLTEGSYAFVNVALQIKNPGDAVITLARSTFRTASDNQLPATMMRSYTVSYSPQPSTTASSSSPSSSVTSSTNKPTESSGGSSQTTASSSISESSATTLTEEPSADSGLNVKLALLLGSIVLVALIVLVLKLPRNKSKMHRK